MYIRRLSLTNFRNYARLELDLIPQTILIYGDNAQGKTTLLEAIYYLATSRSPQTSSDRELINWMADKQDPAPYARLETEVVRGEQARQVDIALQKEPVGGPGGGRFRLRKQIRVDQAARRALDLVGQINVVLFQPQDVELVDGSPSGRRRYLDVTLCQVNPTYCRSLSRYKRVMSERNALLKQWDERRVDPDELAYWDEQLVRYGVVVVIARRDAVRELGQRAGDLHYQLSGGQERLELVYQPSFDPGAEEDGQALEAAYRAELKRRRRDETARGVTLIGPHRDEMCFVSNGEIDLRTYGSRGQQRTAVIALKLAEVAWMRQRTGEWPILLLDEVLAELDVNRRNFLLAQVNGIEQTLITTTDPHLFDPHFLSESWVLRVNQGRVTEAEGGVEPEGAGESKRVDKPNGL